MIGSNTPLMIWSDRSSWINGRPGISATSAAEGQHAGEDSVEDRRLHEIDYETPRSKPKDSQIGVSRGERQNRRCQQRCADQPHAEEHGGVSAEEGRQREAASLAC